MNIERRPLHAERRPAADDTARAVGAVTPGTPFIGAQSWTPVSRSSCHPLTPSPPPPLAPRRAFTLIEMLIVMAIVMVLLSLLVVGLNFATKSAQSANTRSLMMAISSGLVQFRNDVGYLPPVLDRGRNLLEPPLPAVGTAAYTDEIQDWNSWTSLAEYLIGYGEGRYDGYGAGPDSPGHSGEVPATGIRHPGNDGVWGASQDNGRFVARDPIPPQAGGPGKVYGPYLELDDERLLGALNTDTGQIYFPGEGGYSEDLPKVIVDYWGEPIFYYRRNYPPGSLGQSYRAVDYDGDGVRDRVPTLSDVIALRGYEVATGGASDRLDTPDGRGDTTTTLALESAEFGLLSKGPDRQHDPEFRVDDDELNRDNIIEVGQ